MSFLKFFYYGVRFLFESFIDKAENQGFDCVSMLKTMGKVLLKQDVEDVYITFVFYRKCWPI